MINKILMGIFKIVVSLISLLLTPINNLIDQTMPSLNAALTGVADVLQTGATYVGWLLNAMCINSTTRSLLVSALIFKLTFPLAVSIFKTIIKWYDKLKV